MLICLCKMLEEPHVHLVASSSVYASVAAEKYKDDPVFSTALVSRDGGRVVSVFACGSFLHPSVRRSPPCTAPAEPRSHIHSRNWAAVPWLQPPAATPGKRPSNSQTSHYHNIHPIRLHTFTIKTDTFTDACIIIHKDQTSFDTLDSTLEKWHIIYLIIHAA